MNFEAKRGARYLDEWPYVGLNMSRSLGDAKLHAVCVSDVPDVATVLFGASMSQLRPGIRHELGTCQGFSKGL